MTNLFPFICDKNRKRLLRLLIAPEVEEDKIREATAAKVISVYPAVAAVLTELGAFSH